MLGEINIEPFVYPKDYQDQNDFTKKPHINWVICGAETGVRARLMNNVWARHLAYQCKILHIPFFMKQMSKRQAIPPYLSIRQFPET